MNTGKVDIIYGEKGTGKTAFAMGKALRALARQKTVIVIEFLKGNQKPDYASALGRLEPELKMFRFEKSDCYFDRLTEDEKREARMNIRNGIGYARKVLMTGECDLLVLDEVLGLLDQGIIGRDELRMLLDCRDEADVILTGRVLPEHAEELADRIEEIRICPLKEDIED